MKIKHGYWKTESIHVVHYQYCGNQKGAPIFVIHGGPGGGFSDKIWQLFDLDTQFVVLIDQRGTNQSTPFGELKDNNTQLLVEDILNIKKQLNLGKINLFGGSWGTTLALCFAIKYPEEVQSLLLRGVFLGRQEDIDYLYEKGGASDFYPDYFETFNNFITSYPGSTNIQKYFNLFTSSNPNKTKAFEIFATWEDSLVSIKAFKNSQRNPLLDKQISLMESYYFVNKCFLLEDNYILNNLEKIEDIPTTIVHGRQDVDTRPIGAWLLNKGLKNSKLILVDGAGHSMWEHNLLLHLKEEISKIK
ncbi:prolyl aminopeptidase [Mycoplasmopsis sturni]|uniref:prolyl aminopeptidase n=1 Tax=Mycoplasmopsis sturni TaxID=39047 RepID=UPI0005612884|nr:prolyl aminopeptidase [Mycoplasmopsis sturni]